MLINDKDSINDGLLNALEKLVCSKAAKAMRYCPCVGDSSEDSIVTVTNSNLILNLIYHIYLGSVGFIKIDNFLKYFINFL